MSTPICTQECTSDFSERERMSESYQETEDKQAKLGGRIVIGSVANTPACAGKGETEEDRNTTVTAHHECKRKNAVYQTKENLIDCCL